MYTLILTLLISCHAYCLYCFFETLSFLAWRSPRPLRAWLLEAADHSRFRRCVVSSVWSRALSKSAVIRYSAGLCWLQCPFLFSENSGQRLNVVAILGMQAVKAAHWHRCLSSLVRRVQPSCSSSSEAGNQLICAISRRHTVILNDNHFSI